MNRPTFSKFKKKALSKKSVNEEYQSLASSYELSEKLIRLRQQTGLTQKQVADLIHIQKNNISRLENADYSYSLKLSTLEQYAHAIGYNVEINFVPINKQADMQA